MHPVHTFPYYFPNIHCIHFPSLRSFQRIHPSQRQCRAFRNKLFLHDEDLLTPRPSPIPEDRPLSAVHDCLFHIFAATLHIWTQSPLTASRRRAMQRWEEVTWHGKYVPEIRGLWIVALNHTTHSFTLNNRLKLPLL
jgi:hypothetical protein